MSNDNAPVPVSQLSGMQVSPQGVQSTAKATRMMDVMRSQMQLAMMRPRDYDRVRAAVIRECGDTELADHAEYEYPRGGEMVSGASIRLIEMLGRCMGNITWGFDEIDRGADFTIVEAYAHDCETNTRPTRTFTVKHERGTRSGIKMLTDPRDIKEHVASISQRVVRECIKALVPLELVSTALHQCHNTLVQSDDRPLKERVNAMLDEFAKFGVSQGAIEKFFGIEARALSEGQMARLKRIYRSIRDGIAPAEQFFDLSMATGSGAIGGGGSGRTSGGGGQSRRRKNQDQSDEQPPPHQEAPPEQATETQGPSLTSVLGMVKSAKNEAMLDEAADLARSLPEDEAEQVKNAIKNKRSRLTGSDSLE